MLQGYRKAHEDLWPSISASMADNGVSMAIYHHQGKLFLFATAPDEDAWRRSRENPDLAQWDAMITQFVETDQDGKIDFARPQQVFGFGDFA